MKNMHSIKSTHLCSHVDYKLVCASVIALPKWKKMEYYDQPKE